MIARSALTCPELLHWFFSPSASPDVVSTLTDGFKYKAAVEDDLQKATRIKPQVGFKWSN